MDDGDDIESLYKSVGRFAINWARLEMALDLVVLTGRARFFATRQSVPVHLSEKLTLVETDIIPLLPAERSAQLSALVRKIRDKSETRHSVIHGAAYDYPLDGSRTVSFATMLQPPKKPRRPPLKTSLMKIDELADDVWDMEGLLLDEAQAL
jgi:hypothetical protein